MQVQSHVADTDHTSGPATNDSTNAAGWRFVTVEQASLWLARRQHNRPVRKTDVTFLARQMREGLWRKNPQPLLFGESTGRLVDGQHRLSAMIEAETPMWFRIDVVEDNVMPVLDTGRTRTAADVISLYDTDKVGGSYSAQAAALKLLLAWEKNRNPFIGQAGGSGRISNVEVIRALPLYPMIPRNVQRATQIGYQGIPGGAGTWGALLTKFEAIDSDRCDEFFDGMLTGAELPEGSAILAVRNRLRASRNTRYALPRVELATIVVRGWNAFVKDRPLTVIKGRVRSEPSGRPTDASFPVVESPSKSTTPAAA